METVVLETDRLQLRPMREDDLDGLLAIFADARVMAAFGEPPFNREQMAGWLGRNLDHQARHGYGLFAVLHKASGTLIGDCGLEIMAIDGALQAELGYDFRSDFWGQGYATEAAAAVRDYAFGRLGLVQLVSLIRVGNHPSRRVAETIGMRLLSQYEHYGRSYWKYGLARPTA